MLSKNDSHLLPLTTSLEGTRNGVGHRKLCCGSCSVWSRHFIQFCKPWEVLNEFRWAFWVMYVLSGSVIYQSFFSPPFTISFYPEVLYGIGQKQKFNYLSNSFVIYNEERNFLCFWFFFFFLLFPCFSTASHSMTRSECCKINVGCVNKWIKEKREIPDELRIDCQLEIFNIYFHFISVIVSSLYIIWA